MQIYNIILAAGEGKRMRPLTLSTPKPMAKVNDKTLLQINVENLSLISSDFVLVLNYLAEQIQEYSQLAFPDFKFNFATQDSPTGGTLDSFRMGVNLLLQNNMAFDGLVVSNADNILGPKFYSTLQIAITKDPTKAYFMAAKMDDLELLKTQGVFVGSGENLRIVEKPQEFISDLANVGLYYFPTHSVNFLPSKPVELVNEEYITDFMNLCVENNEVEVIGVDDLYFPISDLQDLQKAQELV